MMSEASPDSSVTTCSACRHTIDAAAKLCPFCGADPQTGQKVIDTQAVLQEVFQPRAITTSESVLEYARQRQGIVIALSLFAAFLILGLLHQFVTVRNEQVDTGTPPVPLTEVTDLSRRPTEAPRPIPELDFQYDGQPQAMQTFIIEPGAVAPVAPPAATPPATAGAAPAGPAPATAARQAAPPTR